MPRKQHQNWWTGKDSNLRNSQGVTDLQSVGFNHSPTCPDFPTSRPPRTLPHGPVGVNSSIPHLFQEPLSDFDQFDVGRLWNLIAIRPHRGQVLLKSFPN